MEADPSLIDLSRTPAVVPRRASAVEFVREMRGRTRPCLLRCDDNEYYVVKPLEGCGGVASAATEVLATMLAILLGLPVPAPAEVTVPSGIWPTSLRNGRPGFGGDDRAGEICFGTVYVGTTPVCPAVDFLPRKLLQRVANLRTAYLGGFVFDLWTYNCGQPKFIFRRAHRLGHDAWRAVIINRDECFSGDKFSSPTCCGTRLAYLSNLLGVPQTVDSFEPYLRDVEGFPLSWLQAYASAVRREWLEAGRCDTSSLIQSLSERRAEVRREIQGLCAAS